MPEYVDPAVEELRGSSSSTPVPLLIGASVDRADLRASLERFDVAVQDEIGRTALLVRTEESIVDDLCELDDISSIELDHEDVAVRDKRNANSRLRVTR